MSKRGYGVDLRERAVAAYEAGKGSLREVAEDFDVSVNTLVNWRALQAQTGSLEPRRNGGGNPSKIQAREEQWLRDWLDKQPDLTLGELVERFARKGVELSQMALSRAPTHGHHSKKKSLYAVERDRPEVVTQRAHWQERAITFPVGDLLFLDESGFNLGMTRRYGWAPSDHRAVGAVPHHARANLTVVACLGTRGVVAPWFEAETMNGDRFLEYVRCVLAPKLAPDDVMVMDNVRFHKVAGVQEAIEARGAHVLYLPPYSPDFSPIENAWSKIKAIVCALAPRSMKDFFKAMRHAFASIKRDDILGWFGHCGYAHNINR